MSARMRKTKPADLTPTDGRGSALAPGDPCTIAGYTGTWSYVRPDSDQAVYGCPTVDLAPTTLDFPTVAGVFRRHGDGFELVARFADVYRLGLARDLEAEEADQVQRDELRRYRRRSRRTAEQRANGPCTKRQIKAIIMEGRRLGFSVEVLRGFTRNNSLSKQTVREAGQLLESLRSGKRSEPQMTQSAQIEHSPSASSALSVVNPPSSPAQEHA